MTTLHLGIVEAPYVEAPSAPAKGRRKKATPSTVTTGDVATWIENKYHVFEIFYELHQQEIADAVSNSLAGTIESLLQGAPPSLDAFGAAQGEIDALFRKFLTGKEMDGLGIPGIPTKAALDGVSHRFKSRRGPPRPSFIDTGLYEADFKSWID